MPREDAFTSHGLKIHVDCYEAGPAAPVLVFVHGTAMYARVYAGFLERLAAAGYTVVAVDLRGHGRSEGKRGDFTIAEQLAVIGDTIGYAIQRYNPRVGLIGSSQGGILTLYTATCDPRIRAAICHNVALLTEPETVQINIQKRSKALRSLIGPVSRLLPWFRMGIWQYLYPETVFTDLNLWKQVESDPLIVRSYTMRTFGSLASTPPPAPVERITAPVLFLQAEHDRLFPRAYTESIYRRLQCPKEMAIIGGAEHMLFVEYVDSTLPVLLRWLREHLPASSAATQA